MVRNKPIISLNQVSYETIEMDSHADTAICVSNFVILDYTSQECDVTPYNAKDIEKNVPIATCAISWDDSTFKHISERSTKPFILVTVEWSTLY